MNRTQQPLIGSGTVATRDGVALFFEARGESGPNVVLLANFFMDATSWRPFTARLGEDHRLWAYDPRGQGASAHPAEAGSWQQHVDDLEDLLDALGIEDAYFVGTSFSALLCRDFAIAHPDRTRGLVLAGPAMSPWGKRKHRRITAAWLKILDGVGLPTLYDLMYVLVSGDRRAEAAGQAGFIGRKQAFLSRHTAAEVRAGMVAAMEADADPALLNKVSCPVLVMSGDDDFALGVSGARELARLLPRGRCSMLPHVGHIPFIEETAVFEAEVAAFIAEIEASGTASADRL